MAGVLGLGEQAGMRLGRQIVTMYYEGLMCIDFILEVIGSC